MSTLKRILGIVWIALGIAAGYYLLINQAFPKFQSDKSEDLIPAIIYTFVLAPIIVGGLSIFGWYAITNEYDE